jgi:hypothetical protein
VRRALISRKAAESFVLEKQFLYGNDFSKHSESARKLHKAKAGIETSSIPRQIKNSIADGRALRGTLDRHEK